MTRVDATIERAGGEIHQPRLAVLIGEQGTTACLAEHPGETGGRSVRCQVLGTLDPNVCAVDHGSSSG
jgi:hypothetical protein